MCVRCLLSYFFTGLSACSLDNALPTEANPKSYVLPGSKAVVKT